MKKAIVCFYEFNISSSAKKQKQDTMEYELGNCYEWKWQLDLYIAVFYLRSI